MRTTIITLGILVTTFLTTNGQVLEVKQGHLGRWKADNCNTCYFNGRQMKPVDGYCYFPIDMDKKPDVYQIGKSCGGKLKLAELKVIERECEEETFDVPELEEYVVVPADKVARHRKERKELMQMFYSRKGGDPLFTIPTGTPAKSLPISKDFAEGNFGTCRIFNGYPKDRHSGVDYPVGKGVPVLSIAEGEVTLVADHYFSGKSVYVYHGNGLFTQYFHLDDFSVKKGDIVKQGQEIGKCGSTGRATGAHLHVGIRWFGERINPNLLYPNGSTLTPKNISTLE